ncbi:MAG: PKD domain-containing protein [Armatimonadetes bacterium]|nr:PKD domain-containing protein [Armatimonadota bacterium]
MKFLPGDFTIAPSAADQSAPAIARSSNGSLAVWSDYRSNPYGSFDYETGRDIYGLRFGPDGAPIGATPFPIATVPAAQENPKVCWNGNHWLVVFETTGLSGTGSYYEKTLAAVRVAPDGQIVDQRPITLYGLGSNSGVQWDLATDGSNWVVACQGTSTSNGTVAVRVGPNGQVLDPSDKLVVPEAYFLRFNLRLAYADGVFMLVMDNVNNDTEYVRFDSNLKVLDPLPVIVQGWRTQSLSSDGTNFLLASERQLSDFTNHIWVNRVNAQGQKLDGDGRDVSGSFQPYGQSGPLASWSGSDWRVTWPVFGGVRMATVRADGTVVAAGGLAVQGAQYGPIAALPDGGAQTVWSDYDNSSNNIFGTRILAGGTTLGEHGVSNAAPQQVRPDAATNGSGFMVVYRSTDSAVARVMAVPLDALGNPLLAEPVTLTTGPAINGPTTPQVCWTPSGYIVAWGNGATIFVQRIRPDGSLVDPGPVAVMSGIFGPSDVCAIGDTALVLGRKSFQGGQVITAYGTRIRSTDMAVLDATPVVLGGGYVSRPPSVVALGGRFLVVFMSNWSHDNSIADTAGIFVPTSGAPGASFAVHTTYSTAGGNGIFEIGLASNGSRAIMVQSQELTSGVETDMLCRFIDSTGTVSAAKNLTPWSGNQYRPRVDWDGRHFVIAYQEQKNRTTYWTLDQIDARGDLFGMRVTPEGTVVDPQGFVFNRSPIGESDPTVVSNAGRTIYFGSLMQNAQGLTNYRIGYDVLGSQDNVAPVAVATATPSSGTVPLPVSFSAAGSLDPDGTIVSYFWDFGDGSTSTLPDPSHTYVEGVPRTVELTVTDNGGLKTRQAILVWPKQKNLPPVAVGVATPANGHPSLDAVFTATGSYDPDGLVGNIRWTFGDDHSDYWGATGYHTFGQRGIWPVDLTVWDSDQATTTNRLHVVVGPSSLETPVDVSTTVGLYQSGDASSLATSNDVGYEIREGATASLNGPAAQFEAGFVVDQSTAEGFVVRFESSVTANPSGNVRQKLYAWNVQTGRWDLLDDRPSVKSDVPYEVAVMTGASRYLDSGTRTVKLRMSWTKSGVLAARGWRAKTDHLRLAVLYP